MALVGKHTSWLALIGTGLAFGGTLEVTIVDSAQNGRPTPARVYLTDAKGNFLRPEGVIAYERERFGFAERHFVPPSGRFRVELPEGSYFLEVEKGKEYIPVRRRVRVRAQGRTLIRIVLERWVDAVSLGWYSGDLHLHRPLRDTPTLMEAEDLNVTTPITRWRYANEPVRVDPDLDKYLAAAQPDAAYHISERRLFLVVNEELEPPEAAILTHGWTQPESELQYPLLRYAERARAHGALVDSEKATNLELPVVAALGMCDVVGVANNHFWRTGWYSGPWGAWPGAMPIKRPVTCLGYALGGLDIYYALLAAGLRLGLSAGSANGVHPVPPGWSRVYVHLDEPLSAKAWLQALRAGRSFVTTGPLLILRVNGQLPGATLELAAFPAHLNVELELWSLEPVTDCELVIDGQPQRLRLERDPGRLHRYVRQYTVEMTGPGWIAARYLAEQKLGCTLAHTSPVWVLEQAGSFPVRQAAVHYLLDRVHHLRERLLAPQADDPWAKTVGATPELKAQALRMLDEAEQAYRERLRQPR